MGWSFEILDGHNRLQLAQFDLDPPCFWQLSPDVLFPMAISAAWCHRCEDFVSIERLPTLASIEERIQRVEASHDAEQARTQKLQRWQMANEWLQNRKSPPRCLACGSVTGVVSLKDAPIDVPISHPGDPGRTILIGSVVHYSGPFQPPARDEPKACYDREGNRLSQQAEV
jgi:hypothetical protein